MDGKDSVPKAMPASKLLEARLELIKYLIRALMLQNFPRLKLIVSLRR